MYSTSFCFCWLIQSSPLILNRSQWNNQMWVCVRETLMDILQGSYHSACTGQAIYWYFLCFQISNLLLVIIQFLPFQVLKKRIKNMFSSSVGKSVRINRELCHKHLLRCILKLLWSILQDRIFLDYHRWAVSTIICCDSTDLHYIDTKQN